MKLEATFVASYAAMDQLPTDRRPQVAVAGRSNVGKSSLLNTIVGRKKIAKVSSTPGRTRLLNFFDINERFYIVDLPGYGYAKVSKSMRNEWGRLLEEYLVTCENLIGMVLLLDCRRDPTPEDRKLIDWLAQRGLPVMIAVTKADKLSKDKIKRKVAEIEAELGAAALAFSAVSATGKVELVRSINNLVDEHLKKA